ncbi:hypothetical protein [Sphaerisporangium sp. NPDC051011]|uniref:hypothetical protein n=1 Tax=Sphaerisporangium sp. NPDC051011 TaxID=3155792 RepID=UPI0033F23351
MTLRRMLTTSAAGLVALTVLAEAPASLAGTDVHAPPPSSRPGSPAVSPVPAAPPVPSGASRRPERPVIRSVRVRPKSPVARPRGAVRLVVEVVAKGASGKDGVTLRLEPARRRATAKRPAVRKHSAAGKRRAARKRPVAGKRHGMAGRSLPARAGVGEGGVRVPAPGAAGRWEMWRFGPPVGLTRWYPSGRWRVVATARNARGARSTASSSFLFKKATVLTGVRVTPVRKRPWLARVSGTLMRVDPAGRFDYWSFPGQRVTLRFRSHRGKTWRTVAEARTNREGRFSRRVRRAHGVWRAIYPGTPHYASSATISRQMSRK